MRLLDTRDCHALTRGTSAEIRVSQGAAGLIRSLAVSSDGHTLAVGHSSGYISLVDIRTGRLRTGFKVLGLNFVLKEKTVLHPRIILTRIDKRDKQGPFL